LGDNLDDKLKEAIPQVKINRLKIKTEEQERKLDRQESELALALKRVMFYSIVTKLLLEELAERQTEEEKKDKHWLQNLREEIDERLEWFEKHV
jgi:hypothetical protein